MNLNELLESLDNAAMEKKAAQKQDEDKPLVSKELEAVLTKEASAKNATRAFEEGEKLAKEVLEKLASEAILQAQPQPVETKQETTESTSETKEQEKVAEETEEAKPATVETELTEEDMNKQAQEAGKSIATAILEKLASGVVGQPMPENNAQGPNKLQQDQTVLVAEHDARVQPTPGRNGTIGQMMDAMVAKAKSMGSAAYDQAASGDTTADKEGGDPAQGTPAMAPSPDVVEKQAAVQALIDVGMGWEDAVDLVKAAAEEIKEEELGQIKLATVQELMSQGIDFNTAVAAVEEVAKEI